MRIPKKLPYCFKDNATAEITNGKGEVQDGHEIFSAIYSGPCNFSQSTKRIQNKEGIWVPLAGVIHIKGDIDPEHDVVSCRVSINGNTYHGDGHKVRNPDGSINHTLIELER